MSSTHVIPIERRKHTRHPWSGPVVGIYRDGQGRSVTEEMRPVDISEGGMGVMARRLHRVGDPIALYLRTDQGGRLLHARVVRCWQVGSGSRLGLVFEPGPAEAIFTSDRPIHAA